MHIDFINKFYCGGKDGGGGKIGTSSSIPSSGSDPPLILNNSFGVNPNKKF